jgi:hypothetical protein
MRRGGLENELHEMTYETKSTKMGSPLRSNDDRIQQTPYVPLVVIEPNANCAMRSALFESLALQTNEH